MQLRARLLALLLAACAVRARPIEAPGETIFSSDTTGVAASRHPIAYTDDAEADRVRSLPGWSGSLGLNLFAGYITVDKDAGRALFYTFVESAGLPESDPVVLWLNGGPGCSSLAGGFLSELGPFFPTPAGKALSANAYSWHRVANMIYLDSPAFVGYSYSNSSEDLIVGDKRTARDARVFLLGFFERFPHLKANVFWLSGESYAGHYVPNLALEIVKGNKAAKSAAAEAGGSGDSSASGRPPRMLREDRSRPRGIINLKGFLVGNAWTDATFDNKGALNYWHSHGLISFAARDGVEESCDFSRIGPLLESSRASSAGASAQGQDDSVSTAALHESDSSSHGSASTSSSSGGSSLTKKDDAKCDKYVNLAFDQIKGINIYDIYADVCLSGGAKVGAAEVAMLGAMLAGHPASLASRPVAVAQQRIRAVRLQGGRPGEPASKYDPCVDSEVELYLGRRDVQDALHANVSGKMDWRFETCNHNIKYSRRDLLSSMIPVYERLMKEDLEILVYSGDVDAIVPVIGTRNWIHSLDLEETEAWRDWRSTTRQVGGWTVRYKGLTFASVRGAGHMVPYTQPERALYLFERWVHGRPL